MVATLKKGTAPAPPACVCAAGDVTGPDLSDSTKVISLSHTLSPLWRKLAMKSVRPRGVF